MGLGPVQARLKLPEIVDLGIRAGFGGPGQSEQFARAQHIIEQQAKYWRSTKAAERYGSEKDKTKGVESAVWLSALSLVTQHEPSLENFVYLCAAAYDWRAARSLVGLSASAWAFGDFLDTEVGKKLISACVEDDTLRERMAARYAILAKDLRANVDGDQLRPKADEVELLAECCAAAERLEEKLNTRLRAPSSAGEISGEVPSRAFSGVASCLRLLQERGQGRGSDTDAPGPSGEDPVATAEEPQGSSSKFDPLSWVTQAAVELRGKSRQNPFGHVLLRTVCWTDHLLRSARPTALRADDLKQLDECLRDGHAAQCLELCEKLFLQHPMALDLSYFCARALELLDFMQEREAIGYLTFVLIEQYPRLLNQRDMPELHPDTKRWLQQEQIRWSRQAAEAKVTLPTNDIIGALTLLQRSMMQTRSRSRQFQLRLDMAEYCLGQGRANLATPILELLTQEAEAFRLAEWDPELFTTLLLMEERAATLGQADPASVQQRVRARLCQLDPVMVAKLDASSA